MVTAALLAPGLRKRIYGTRPASVALDPRVLIETGSERGGRKSAKEVAQLLGATTVQRGLYGTTYSGDGVSVTRGHRLPGFRRNRGGNVLVTTSDPAQTAAVLTYDGVRRRLAGEPPRGSLNYIDAHIPPVTDEHSALRLGRNTPGSRRRPGNLAFGSGYTTVPGRRLPDLRSGAGLARSSAADLLEQGVAHRRHLNEQGAGSIPGTRKPGLGIASYSDGHARAESAPGAKAEASELTAFVARKLGPAATAASLGVQPDSLSGVLADMRTAESMDNPLAAGKHVLHSIMQNQARA